MDYEKAYKEALERAREFQKSKDGLCVLTAESIFPELKESEEEKIRKWLLDTITQIPNDSIEWDVIEKAKVLSWLEKQGEQKSPWSEDDEDFYNDIIKYFSELDYPLSHEEEYVINWLKSLKERLS